MDTNPSAVEAVVVRIADDLTARYAGVFSRETVRRCVTESYQLLDVQARVKIHLPPLTQRFAADRLAATAKIQGLTMPDVPEVLFVCVHNAGRSQMAAALLGAHAAGRVRVRSAGTIPAEEIHPEVREAVSEIGLDVSQEFPKPLTDDAVAAADVVITMGCGDACPVFPGKRYLDWDLPDPAGQPLDQVRAIRDDIDTRVRALLTELTYSTQQSL